RRRGHRLRMRTWVAVRTSSANPAGLSPSAVSVRGVHPAYRFPELGHRLGMAGHEASLWHTIAAPAAIDYGQAGLATDEGAGRDVPGLKAMQCDGGPTAGRDGRQGECR